MMFTRRSPSLPLWLPIQPMERIGVFLPIAYQPALLYYNQSWGQEMGF